MLLLNILLTLLWVATTADPSVGNVVAGFVLSYLVLWLVGATLGRSSYFVRFPRAISFALFFAKEMIKANVRVAAAVLLGWGRLQPAIVAVPLDVESDAAITLLANLITLTPGTLSLDVPTDRRVLYVHTFWVDDPEVFRRDIKEGFERRIAELFS